MSAVGVGMLHNAAAGWLLLGVHWLSSLLLGAALGFVWRRHPAQVPRAPKGAVAIQRVPLSEAFVAGTAAAAAGMFSICAFVILFSCLLSLLGALSMAGESYRLLAALLETTSGCRELAVAKVSLPLISAALGFGGLCVHFQVLSCAGEIGRYAAKYFLKTPRTSLKRFYNQGAL